MTAERAPDPTAWAEARGLVGTSAVMTRVWDLARSAAACEAPVLISGETGTGKTRLASALVATGAGRPPTRVDCRSPGVAPAWDELRAGGPVILEHVDTLDPELQSGLVAALEAAGETETSPRIVATTTRILDPARGSIPVRLDLLYRLRTIELVLPPLRDREGDVEALARWYLGQSGRSGRTLSAALVQVLRRYAWPGNVRELFGVIDAAEVVAGDAEALRPEHLPPSVRSAASGPAMQAGESGPELLPLREYRLIEVDASERKYLVDLLARTGGNVSAACRIADVSRSRLYGLLKKHNLQRHG